MAAPLIHAIDGGMFGHALCEEPTGDSTDYERDVTCSECLDLIERAKPELIQRMCRQGWAPTTMPAWAETALRGGR